MTAASRPISVAVLGGSGYVAGEVLRLLGAHPQVKVESVVSTTQVGETVAHVFPHLEGTVTGPLVFEEVTALTARFAAEAPWGILAATPHGATAALVRQVLDAANARGTMARVVDLSADFRFREAAQYQAIYSHPHGAPQLLADFTCGVPEHIKAKPRLHATQPGCFTTAVTLAAYPFFALGLVEASVFVAAVTGSTGSGRTPAANTHHPERRSNLFAYAPLGHRHEAEMRRLLSAARVDQEVDVEFVPHSGPFARGIHATLRLHLKEALPPQELVTRVNEFYADSPFVHATPELPRLHDVVGTNRCRIGIATREKTLVVTSVIDNLVKGAAGGAIQWLNRLFDLPHATGLVTGGLGWL
ncbi:MAG: N-acetyl-gamma-glutamyl-phosphate reductase [Deltaproteobacteria bacterium]|nr:N-acetyl-gamma-glutamyl-phosphate reductase [Deltaproteobacteria bacterium]